MLRWIVAFSLVAQSQALFAEDLSLICKGVMRGLFKDRSVGGMVTDSSGNAVTGGGSSMKYGEVETTALFTIEGEGARLNLPQPPTCGICVGEKGWRDVKELKIEQNRISGKIRYGMFSGTSFEIDRITGIMTSRNGFEGRCEAQDLSVRRF